MKIVCSLFLLLLFAPLVFAQTQEQVIVVSASKVPQTIERTGSSVSIVSADDISVRGNPDIVSALQPLHGVYVGRNGGVGHVSSVYVRGANAEHIKVFINGVAVNDPLGFGRAADLSGLNLRDIERIEIIKGAQSSLYGSDAMGGVINIITKKGGKYPSSFFIEGGSYSTYRYAVSSGGGNEKFGYNVSYNWFETKGFSVADERMGNREDDGYRAGTFSVDFNGKINTLEYDVFSQYSDESADLDGSNHEKLEDTFRDVQKKTTFYLLGKIGLELFDSFWRPEIKASYANHNRNYYNEMSISAYDSAMKEVELQNNLRWSEDHVSVIGAVLQREEGKSSSSGLYSNKFDNQKANTLGAYFEDNISIGDNFSASGCIRVDDHDIAGHSATWRIAPILGVGSGFSVRASYGTGFKAPSLYQLYSPYGNTDLDSEKSKSMDAGIEYSAENKKFNASAVYFENKYDSLIDFVYQLWKYTNINSATSRGIELYSKWNISDRNFIAISFTRTETEDGNGRELLRRPKNKVTGEMGGNLLPKTQLIFSAIYVGERRDYDFSSGKDVVLSDYYLLNLSGNYQVSKNIKVHARIENLLDENYEEVSGYGTAGFSIYGGMEYTF